MTKNFFYIAQYFTPEPYLKDIDFIKSIQKKGWNPVVITGFPNYPKGQIYEGYKNKLFFIEEMQGIKVIRTFTFADHSLNNIKRILNYAVFGILASFAILKYAKRDSFYYVLQSSPFVLFCAYTVRLFKRNSKILLDIQDLFPENIKVSGFVKQKWKIDILDFVLNKFYYKTFDLFVTVSESFRQIIIKKGFNENNVHTLYNWSMIESDLENKIFDFKYSTHGFNIAYAGNIGVHQGLSKLSNAITEITSRNNEIFFHFFGDGTDYEPLFKRLKNNKNVFFYGRVEPEEISKYLYAANALFLHLIKDPIYESIIPSKLQAYIEIGKPILAGLEGEARNFVEINKLGVTFDSENEQEFVKACIEISSFKEENIMNIRERSLNLYQEKFSRKAGINNLNNFILNHYDYSTKSKE